MDDYYVLTPILLNVVEQSCFCAQRWHMETKSELIALRDKDLKARLDDLVKRLRANDGAVNASDIIRAALIEKIARIEEDGFFSTHATLERKASDEQTKRQASAAVTKARGRRRVE